MAAMGAAVADESLSGCLATAAPQQQRRFWRLSGTIRTAEPHIFALVPLARVSGKSGASGAGAWMNASGLRREEAASKAKTAHFGGFSTVLRFP